MKSLLRFRVLSAASLTVLMGLVGVGLVISTVLPVQRMWERRQWERGKPQRDEVDLRWSSGSSHGTARVLIEDGRVVDGTDLRSGQPLVGHSLATIAPFASVDSLYALIDKLEHPLTHWRRQLMRYAPWLVQRLDDCMAPGPEVEYDGTTHYPTRVRWFAGRCYPGFNLSVTIDKLRPVS